MNACNSMEGQSSSNGTIPKLLLVGLPSTGKTTVGRLLAQRTGRPFFDTNEIIASQTGLSPKCLIRRQGEVHFQALESAALQKALQTEGAIVAGGSGIVAVDANRPGPDCIVLWIRRSIVSQFPPERRPVSQSKSFTTLYNKNTMLYNAWARRAYDNKDPEETASQIIADFGLQEISRPANPAPDAQK